MIALRGFGMFSIVVVAAALLLGAAGGLGRPDQVLGDWVTAHDGRPAADDIVIVAIDDRSLAALGRWPWRRGVHAALLDRLAMAGPAAIGLDLILSEPDTLHPDDDQALAEAIRRAGKVVLPMRMEGGPGQVPMAVLPIQPLAQAAAAAGGGSGHIHIELDPDGIARSVFLREGNAGRWWNHLAIEMLRTAGHPRTPDRLPVERRPDLDPRTGEVPDHPGWWLRDYAFRIPYAGPPGHFLHLSYIDVLEGRVSSERLRGRYVFVGATAAGMGDAYPTPAASQDGLMAGVEISANVLDAVRRGLGLRHPASWQNALFTAAPLLLALAGLRRLQPRAALITIAALMAATLGATYAAQHWFAYQFAPTAALVCLGLLYPLWSWRRLEAALGYLAAEFHRIEGEQGTPLERRLAGPGDRAPLPQDGDVLDRRITALSDAAERLRALQRFVRQGMDSLPDPVLVTAADGTILLANRAAERTLGEVDITLPGLAVDALLARHLVSTDREQLPKLSAGDSAGPEQAQPGAARHIESFELRVRVAQGHAALLKGVPRRDGHGLFSGWILSIVDVSLLLQAQRQREEALRFISHDMRAPQSSILTLIELERDRGGAPGRDVLDRIESHARRTLALADAFVDLARAQSDAVVFAPINLSDVVLDAVDQFWGLAHARRIDLVAELPDEAGWCLGDYGLLVRAVGNLIDNALKYGPADARVLCGLKPVGKDWEISVRDAGPGIPAADRGRVFEQFTRLAADGPGAGGFGLGLALVRAVMLRHGGRADLRSEPGIGTVFALFIPAITVPVEDFTSDAR